MNEEQVQAMLRSMYARELALGLLVGVCIGVALGAVLYWVWSLSRDFARGARALVTRTPVELHYEQLYTDSGGGSGDQGVDRGHETPAAPPEGNGTEPHYGRATGRTRSRAEIT